MLNRLKKFFSDVCSELRIRTWPGLREALTSHVALVEAINYLKSVNGGITFYSGNYECPAFVGSCAHLGGNRCVMESGKNLAEAIDNLKKAVASRQVN